MSGAVFDIEIKLRSRQTMQPNEMGFAAVFCLLFSYFFFFKFMKRASYKTLLCSIETLDV